jgi:hypothetical protein
LRRIGGRFAASRRETRDAGRIRAADTNADAHADADTNADTDTDSG